MRTERHDTRRALALLLTGAWLSCASPAPPAATPAVTPGPRLDAAATIAPRSVSVPDATPRPAAIRLLEETRFTINVQDADLRAVLLGLGRESPMNVVVEPGVQGTVTADLKDASLLEILDQLVRPLGYVYQVRGRLLRIYQTDRETRIYRIDYPSYQRSGSSDLTFSGAIGTRQEMTGVEGSTAGDEDVSTAGVQTVQEQDFWGELEQALGNIVLGAPAAPNPEGAPAVVTPAARVLVARQSGLITVTAEIDTLNEVERYLEEVARSFERQVLIDTRILEITLSDELDLGLDIESAPNLHPFSGVVTRLVTAGLRTATIAQALAPALTQGGFSFGVASQDFGIRLRALARQTDVRVVSTPRIATLNNHKALIKVVRNEVFFVAEVTAEIVEAVGVAQITEFVPQIVPVGVTLDVTPQISEDGQITLHLHPSVSEIVDIVDQPRIEGQTESGRLPVIDLRETDTVLRVPDETTVVIGGLIQSRHFDRENKVPLLGDLPWVGQLFRGTRTEERRTELVILLTPRILDPPRIARIRAESEDSFAALEALRAERSHGSPWWRRPRGVSYEVR